MLKFGIGIRYVDNTNTAEAAHSLVNRTGKQGRKLDEHHLKVIYSAVPYTKRDKSQVKRQLLAINRKENKIMKIKISYSRSNSSKIQSMDENDYEFENDNSRSKKIDTEERHLRLELEIEERRMNLRERNIALRKAAAKVEAIEIANEKAKLALKIN
ncbi:hypothetical protein RclHR1_00300036 [Rhizophagus clarus]|uniref:Uncharacterized protein n=1 Tax=Rhizophagus clarus TaxID=94130 RepID=A0A2Z6R589_9GLOM|nr:hypothetical protein RclHR1_00300036 [Rhizophagus clarus]